MRAEPARGGDRSLRASVAVAAIAATLLGCALPGGGPASGATVTNGSGGFRYVALGDSYTIGTSVAEAERWPNQLVDRLRASGVELELVANLGVNGFTARDVIDVELPRVESLQPQFATLLVGVNDVVQAVNPETYRTNAAKILDTLLALVPARRVVVVATPDYTVTPQGANYGDPVQQSTGIRTANAILKELADSRTIAFVDIYDISLKAATDRSLVARDGLHPSGAQYALWVDRIAPVVQALLGR